MTSSSTRQRRPNGRTVRRVVPLAAVAVLGLGLLNPIGAATAAQTDQVVTWGARTTR